VIAHPHLRELDLMHKQGAMAINQQQLERLCNSCHALETLKFGLCEESPAADLLPLMQLSKLTCLGWLGCKQQQP
jgi:hypothetical protein